MRSASSWIDPDDPDRHHVKVAGVEDKGNGRMLLTTENTFEIEGEDKPALVALFLAMVMN